MRNRKSYVEYSVTTGKPKAVYTSTSALKEAGFFMWSVDQVVEGIRFTHKGSTFRKLADREARKLADVFGKVSVKRAENLGLKISAVRL